MNQDEETKYIKDQLESYLESKGINTRTNFKCLVRSHEHDRQNPGSSYDRSRNKVHCFKCNSDYDIFDLIQAEYNTDTAGAFQIARELYLTNEKQAFRRGDNLKKDINYGQGNKVAVRADFATLQADYTKVIEEAHQKAIETGKIDHFKQRGISDQVIEKYKLGYVDSYNSLLKDYPELQTGSKKQALYNYIIPNLDNDEKCNYFFAEISDREQIDDYNQKYKNMKSLEGKNPVRLFNEQYITRENPPDYVFICEGVYDALSYETAGFESIATMGVSHTRLIHLCRSYKPYTHFVIDLDSDGPGQKGGLEIAEGLKAIGQSYSIAPASSFKDPNEALQADPEAFKEKAYESISASINEKYEMEAQKEAEANAELSEYLKTNAKNYINDFINGVKESANTPPISTGFFHLDYILDGGLYEGLYCMGALTSLGKTTFVLQMADEIAINGHDVLIFSLEMARTELIAKSISRLTYLNCNRNYAIAKTNRGITTGKRYDNYSPEEKDLIQKAINLYSGYAGNLYINEGLGNISTKEIREIVEKHITLTGRRPIVIIDYLQILAPTEPRQTDKQAMDRAVFDLKRISRDNKIPVIAISSLNRNSYTKEIGPTAFKETGAIEYSSDVLIGLQFKGTNDKTTEEEINILKGKEWRDIELKILKNRNGATGGKVDFTYVPMFNYFSEDTPPEDTPPKVRKK